MAPEIVAAENIEDELVGTTALPQELGVDVGGKLLCARSMNPWTPGSAKRNSTFAAFTLARLPWAVSTCSEVLLSARIGADAKAAFVFVENVHGGDAKRCSGAGESKAGPSGRTAPVGRRGLYPTHDPRMATPQKRSTSSR